MSELKTMKHGNRFKDETGKQYGLLSVLSWSHYDAKKHAHFWHCRCTCGTKTIKNGNTLRNGETTSCGCKKVNRWIGNKIKETHGGSYSPLYEVWHGMKSRCYRKNHVAFSRYGGRGIKVCDDWKDNFEVFRKWAIENGYREGLSIDRINNDGGYEPSNCQWLTLADNTRKARLEKKGKYNNGN